MEGQVGIRLFRDRLTAYVARVRRGQRIVVTDRGAPVAVLTPYRAGKRDARDVRLAALFASGHVARAERPFVKAYTPVKGRGKPASRIVVDERR